MSWRCVQRTALAITILALGGAVVAGTGTQAQAHPFRIEGCSLSCTSGPTMVSCGIINVHVNEELTIDFTQAVDLSSVGSFPPGIRIINTSTALSPLGTWRLGPGSRSTLVFQPGLSFDPLGNPVFAFEFGSTYLVRASGILAGDPPPYVLSSGGQPLENRLLCTITTDQGVLDYVPGPPSYTPSVQAVDACEPGAPVHATSAVNARCVSVDSNLTLVFDDIMNLGTLMIPATGNAPFVQVRFAGTGTPVPGNWSHSLDLKAKTTTVVFTPAAPLPTLTKVEVLVPPQVLDLVGNPQVGLPVFRFLTEG